MKGIDAAEARRLESRVVRVSVLTSPDYQTTLAIETEGLMTLEIDALTDPAGVRRRLRVQLWTDLEVLA